MKRVYVFIDGSNFYHNLKRYNINLIDFDFLRFIFSLISLEDTLISLNYFIGKIIYDKKSYKSLQLYSNQQELFKFLQKKNINVFTNNIRKIENKYLEKGIDVMIGINLVEKACENLYDKALLISSDSDLAPAVEMVRKKGKKVELVGFRHNYSYALVRHANKFHFMNENILKQFKTKKILTFGTFDLLHEGHKHFLKKASEYGDLTVIVARDETVEKIKGYLPVWHHGKRKKAVKDLDFVNKVFIGKREDHLLWLSELRPDVICIGYDQEYLVDKILPYCKEHGFEPEIVKIGAFEPDKYKSSILRLSK